MLKATQWVRTTWSSLTTSRDRIRRRIKRTSTRAKKYFVIVWQGRSSLEKKSQKRGNALTKNIRDQILSFPPFVPFVSGLHSFLHHCCLQPVIWLSSFPLESGDANNYTTTDSSSTQLIPTLFEPPPLSSERPALFLNIINRVLWLESRGKGTPE